MKWLIMHAVLAVICGSMLWRSTDGQTFFPYEVWLTLTSGNLLLVAVYAVLIWKQGAH